MVFSRLGHPDMSEIDILLFCPSYTTVPSPDLPSTWIRGAMHTPDVAERQSKSRHIESQARPPRNLLRDGVIAPLEQRGLIASVLTAGSCKWQGIVNIQRKDEEISRRLNIQ
jgi:hypothetical protein